MGSLGFWLIVALAAVVWACAVLVIAEAIGSCARTRDRLDAEALAVEAADFGEPTRVQIEQAIRLTQEDDLASAGGRRGLGVRRG